MASATGTLTSLQFPAVGRPASRPPMTSAMLIPSASCLYQRRPSSPLPFSSALAASHRRRPLTWDRLEDKYVVTSLAFGTLLVLYGSAGLVSAIDRLPLLPGLFELVGIGYTGWFAYRNLVFKPDRWY